MNMSRVGRYCVSSAPCVLAGCAVFLSMGGGPAWGDDPLRIDEGWLQLYRQTAAGLDVRCEGVDEPLTLQPEPVLTYSNPVRMYQQHGALYIWTHRGRSLFAGCIWSGADLESKGEYRYVSHEGHSLAPAAVRAEQQGRVLWKSARPGVRWQEMKSAPPAKSRALRLAQMRSIARILKIEMEADVADLRLLIQPIYRYPEDVADVTDGAIFAWVMGTDPEAFLIVEAGDDGWRAAVARFTNEVVRVSSPDGPLYDCGPIQQRTLEGPYWLNWDVERMPADLNVAPTDTAF